MKSTRLAILALALAASSLTASAQVAISAKAGLVNAADGDIFLDGKAFQPKPSELIDVKPGQVLSAEDGRAEVLLFPGAFLRMPDHSSFKMISSKLNDVRIEVLSGSVLVEVDELLDGNQITLKAGDATLRPSKNGIYRVDTDPQRLRVYQGEAAVVANDKEYTLKGSREMVSSNGAWTEGKFDSKETDALYRWAKRRSEYIAMANRSSAQTAFNGTSGGRWGGLFGSMGFGGYNAAYSGMGGWVYNPWFGTLTYVPMSGLLYSPFGFAYYTPFNVYQAYLPGAYYYGGGRSRPQTPTYNAVAPTVPRGLSNSGIVSMPSLSMDSPRGGFSGNSGMAMPSSRGGGGGAPAAAPPAMGSAGGSGGGGGATVGRGR